ncbi:hypothetical protein [Methylobacterium sp. 1030]|uniref:hypothetical protein n=1 Tax=Methylobacterium sp. 1030 TaxID=3156404 RepID=UPI0033940602
MNTTVTDPLSDLNRMSHEAIREAYAARQAVINGMTNWQRNQAARACKGDWDALGIEELREFAAMERQKA